jgi:hypothetical protein
MIIPQARPQAPKLFHPLQVRGTGLESHPPNEDGAQGAATQGPVVRPDDLAECVLTARHNVASHLADKVETGMLQGSDTVPAGDDGEVRHTVTRRASKCS